MSRKTRRLLLLGIILLATTAAFVTWSYSGRYISTENAYVKTTQVLISPEVSGRVDGVFVNENQPVSAGDLLLSIEAATFEAAVDEALAVIEDIRLDVETRRAAYRLKQKKLELATDNLDFAEREYQRQSRLAKKGMNSESQLDQASHNLKIARQTIDVIKEDLNRLLAGLMGNPELPPEEHPRFLAAQAKLKQARLNLQHTRVLSPITGIATKVPNPGEYIDEGKAIMSVVSTHQPWIEANFMETDLTKVIPGMPVSVTIDTYPGKEWRGRVQSISPATGAEYAILPPQNASGNWVKITQRIPVRISIEPQKGSPVLRKGMTADVVIDTGTYR